MSVTLFICCFKIISGAPKWLQSVGGGGGGRGGEFKCMTRTNEERFWFGNFWQVYFWVAWFKSSSVLWSIQNNLKIRYCSQECYVFKPRSFENTFLGLGNSAWNFVRVQLWSRDLFGLWFLPTFHHPCHLKSRVPPPWVMAHQGILLLLYQSIKLLNFIADGKKSEPSLIFFWVTVGSRAWD